MRKAAALNRIGLAALATIVLAWPTAASAASSPTTEPTITIGRCPDVANPDFPTHTWTASVTGFPPGTRVLASQIAYDHTTGTFLHDDTLYLSPPFAVTFGWLHPMTVFLTVIWEGGTLETSRYINCEQPSYKENCTHQSWRDYPEFKNQGQCVAFVRHGGEPPEAPEPPPVVPPAT